MLLVKSSQNQEKNSVRTSSQDNQLFPPLEGEDTKVSTLKHRAPSPDGSPEAKKARMGSIKQISSCSQSVAERLKESTLKLQEKSAQNGTTPAPVTEVKSPFPVFNAQKELNEEQLNQVRIIAQHLKELGLREAVNALVEETGCKIEHTYASQLRKHMKAGNWIECLLCLEKAKEQLTNDQYATCRSEFVMHHLLALLDKGAVEKFVEIIRYETPRYRNNKEFEAISHLAFYSEERLNKAPIMVAYRSPGYFEKVVKTIEKVLPHTFMLQESRLDGILKKALQQQLHSCHYHMASKGLSKNNGEALLEDHVCEGHDYELHDAQKIGGHEVVKSCFSPNGKFFLTGGSTKRITLYKCMKKTMMLKHLKNLRPKANHKPSRVTDLAWSHDSKFVAVTGTTKKNLEPLKVMVYDVTTGKLHRVIRKASTFDFTSIAFSWGSYKLAVADENGHFMVYDVSEAYEKGESSVVCQWDGLRIRRIHPLRNGSFLALDTHNRIRSYIMAEKKDDTIIREACPVSNFIVHRSEKFVLTNTSVNIHLWDLEEKSLIRTYRTFAAKDLYIDSTFGGPNQEYFASGAPDGRIFVYNINETEPLIKIKGHTAVVNTIAWHPKSGIMASSGNDKTLRVWHIGCELKKCQAFVVKPVQPPSEKLLQKEQKRAQRIVRKEIKKKIKERKRLAKEAKEKEAQENDETSETLSGILGPVIKEGEYKTLDPVLKPMGASLAPLNGLIESKGPSTPMEPTDPKVPKEPKESKVAKEQKEAKCSKDSKESKDPKDFKEKEPTDDKDSTDPKGSKDPKDSTGPKDLKKSEESKDPTETKDPKNPKESKESKEPKESNNSIKEKEKEPVASTSTTPSTSKGKRKEVVSTKEPEKPKEKKKDDKKKKKKHYKREYFVNPVALPFEAMKELSRIKRKERKRKEKMKAKKRTPKETEEISNGKTVPSESENGSSKSHL